MKNMKQQITTAFGSILVVVAVAACAPEQSFAKVKGGMRTKQNGMNVALGDGSVRHRKRTFSSHQPGTGDHVPTESPSFNFKSKRNSKEFDRGYLPPAATNTYTGMTTVNQGRRNNLSVNAGSGNDKINVQSRRRNLVSSQEYFNRYRQPNHFYGTGVYKTNAQFKARGKQDR